MKLVFISGPFTAPTAWGIEQNVRCAEAAALRVAKMGAMPVCPHTNTRFFHGTLPNDREFWLTGAITLMKKCDAVLLIEGWEYSPGARAERHAALGIGMFVTEIEHDLEKWIARAI